MAALMRQAGWSPSRVGPADAPEPREPHGEFAYWRCSECHTLYYGAPDIQSVALRENATGKALNLLAGTGQRKKDAGEELPNGWDRRSAATLT